MATRSRTKEDYIFVVEKLEPWRDAAIPFFGPKFAHTEQHCF